MVWKKDYRFLKGRPFLSMELARRSVESHAHARGYNSSNRSALYQFVNYIPILNWSKRTCRSIGRKAILNERRGAMDGRNDGLTAIDVVGLREI
jgi:hypothetical protein